MCEKKNRFSVLLENNDGPMNTRTFVNDTSEKKSSYFKSERQNNHFSNDMNRGYNRERSQFQRREPIEEKKTVYDAINSNEFPDLIKTNNTINVAQQECANNDINKTSNFLNALKTNDVEIVEQQDSIKDGWVVSSIDKSSGKIMKEYGKNMYTVKPPLTQNLMFCIAKNYEKWKNNYIEIWGEEQYEKMYRFPNYDYKYFHKLDEITAEEMSNYYRENDESSFSNSDYEAYDDYEN